MFHTGEKPYSCFHCIKSFAKLSRLQNHLQVHTREKPFCCTQCSKLFGQKSFSCFHGTKSFTHFFHLQNHLKEPYNCTKCSKSFRQKISLKIHLRVHDKVKPYSCTQCSRLFRQKFAYRNTQEFIPGRKPTAVPSVRSHLYISIICINILELTLVKNPTPAHSV
jgi:uncharacterized Zn-finger protein